MCRERGGFTLVLRDGCLTQQHGALVLVAVADQRLILSAHRSHQDGLLLLGAIGVRIIVLHIAAQIERERERKGGTVVVKRVEEARRNRECVHKCLKNPSEFETHAHTHAHMGESPPREQRIERDCKCE